MTVSAEGTLAHDDQTSHKHYNKTFDTSVAGKHSYNGERETKVRDHSLEIIG